MRHLHHSRLPSTSRSPKLVFVLILNMLVAIVQLVVGLMVNSLAVLSDAMHNLSDVVSLALSYAADRLSMKKPTPERTFGYKRAEILAALFNAASLLALGVLLAREAVGRLFDPQPILGHFVIWVSVLSLVVNSLSALILFRPAQGSLNIRSAYLHLVADAVSSVAVLLGGVLVVVFEVFWVDALLAIMIAIYLVAASWRILLRTLRVLLQFAPKGLNAEQIKVAVERIDGIKNLHHIHLWELTDRDIYLEAHIDFFDDVRLSEANQIMDRVRNMLARDFEVAHVTLQPEVASRHGAELIPENC